MYGADRVYTNIDQLIDDISEAAWNDVLKNATGILVVYTDAYLEIRVQYHNAPEVAFISLQRSTTYMQKSWISLRKITLRKFRQIFLSRGYRNSTHIPPSVIQMVKQHVKDYPPLEDSLPIVVHFTPERYDSLRNINSEEHARLKSEEIKNIEPVDSENGSSKSEELADFEIEEIKNIETYGSENGLKNVLENTGLGTSQIQLTEDFGVYYWYPKVTKKLPKVTLAKVNGRWVSSLNKKGQKKLTTPMRKDNKISKRKITSYKTTGTQTSPPRGISRDTQTTPPPQIHNTEKGKWVPGRTYPIKQSRKNVTAQSQIPTNVYEKSSVCTETSGTNINSINNNIPNINNNIRVPKIILTDIRKLM